MNEEGQQRSGGREGVGRGTRELGTGGCRSGGHGPPGGRELLDHSIEVVEAAGD